MNQNYKAIAEINKKQLIPLLEEEKWLNEILEKDKKANDRKGYWATKQLLDRCKEKIRIIKNIIFGQADYFEKEDTKQAEIGHNFNFERKQFLKDCGVEE